MKFGVTMFMTDQTMGPVDLARAVEARGLHSLYVPEHTHIPLTRRTSPPSGGPLIRPYFEIYDPFIALSTAAAVTKNLKIGTGVCLIPQRDPIVTAKLVSSLDRVSNGRFLFGVGNGWNQDEIENHGTVFKTRMKKMREQMEAMKEIWTKSTAEYSGEIVKVPSMMTWPKPVQKPHPPVIVGGAFPYSARRAIRYGNGWIPQAVRGGYKEIAELIPEFRKMATEAGRDPKSIAITVWFPRKDPDLMKRYEDLGVERVVFSVASEPADKVLPQLDAIGALMTAVNS